jgi:hypothetical protein
MRPSPWLVAALMISAFSSTALAAPKGSWDGTWRGAWGGSRPTSITIANERVVSYEYGGASTPVSASKVTANRVTYGDNGTVVVLTRESSTLATATLHTPQGDASAKLTKQ